MNLNVLVLLFMATIFCILTTIILYFLFFKQEDKLKLNKEKYRFSILKSSLIVSIFFSGTIFTSAIATFIIKSTLIQLIIFIITVVGFVMLRRILIIKTDNSNKGKQRVVLESSNTIEYKESKLSAIGNVILGIFWASYFLLL